MIERDESRATEPGETETGEAPDPEPADAPGAGVETGEEEPTLEERLERLDRIVSALEADDVGLERALALFEEGVGHVRAAERTLSEAETRVEELLGEGEDVETRSLDGEPG